MREVLARLSPEEAHARGLRIADLLTRQAAWKKAATVLSFLSFQQEPDTRPLHLAALMEGKVLGLPVVRSGAMFFREAPGVDGPWISGSYGIREPAPDQPELCLDNLIPPVLLLSSGLAFDRRGARLGRGGGYYDRAIASLRRLDADCLAVGLAHPCQLVGEVPCDEWDEGLDALCDGETMYYVSTTAPGPEGLEVLQ